MARFLYARAALEALLCRYPFKLEDIRRFYFHRSTGSSIASLSRSLAFPKIGLRSMSTDTQPGVGRYARVS
jgi:hypothetical protein